MVASRRHTDGHLDPQERLPFDPQPPLGRYMTDGCLVVVMDDDFTSAQRTMRASDVVAPWHLRSLGAGAPCNYLFVRGEAPIAGRGAGQMPASEAEEPFIKFNSLTQAALLRRIAITPPAQTQPLVMSAQQVVVMAMQAASEPTTGTDAGTGAAMQGDVKGDPFSKHAIVREA